MNRQELLVAIGKQLRISPIEVDAIVRSAPFRYRRYTIPKRDGSEREIFHPSPSLKAIQRWVIDEVLSGLPVHDSVFSYMPKRNIGMNASAHLRSNYFVRYDFRQFFPSITGAVVARFLRRAVRLNHVALDRSSVHAIVRITCRSVDRGRTLALSIGAPSSPLLSNALLFEFDSVVNEVAHHLGVVYTRYADDIYASAADRRALDQFDRLFRAIVSERLPYISINEEKVQWLSRKRRVTITGINISSDRTISVGRELKRSIRTRLYLALGGELDRSEWSRLRGQIAFVMGVERDFLDRLKRKFGEVPVDAFMGATEDPGN